MKEQSIKDDIDQIDFDRLTKLILMKRKKRAVQVTHPLTCNEFVRVAIEQGATREKSMNPEHLAAIHKGIARVGRK